MHFKYPLYTYNLFKFNKIMYHNMGAMEFRVYAKTLGKF